MNGGLEVSAGLQKGKERGPPRDGIDPFIEDSICPVVSVIVPLLLGVAPIAKLS